MTSPLRVMIDTPVAYKLATDPNAEPLMRDAVRSGRLVLVAPHFQRYQVERVPREERDMVVKFVANLTLQTKTAGLILDLTRWEASALPGDTQASAPEPAQIRAGEVPLDVGGRTSKDHTRSGAKQALQTRVVANGLDVCVLERKGTQIRSGSQCCLQQWQRLIGVAIARVEAREVVVSDRLIVGEELDVERVAPPGSLLGSCLVAAIGRPVGEVLGHVVMAVARNDSPDRAGVVGPLTEEIVLTARPDGSHQGRVTGGRGGANSRSGVVAMRLVDLCILRVHIAVVRRALELGFRRAPHRVFRRHVRARC